MRFVKWFLHPANMVSTLGMLVPIGLLGAFLWRYYPQYPMVDIINIHMPIALSIHEGTFRPLDIFTAYAGHRPVWMMLTTTVIAGFGQWDLRYETLILFINAILNVFLLSLLFRRTSQASLALVMVPFAFLLLPTQLGTVWVNLYTGWYQLIFFTILMLLLPVTLPQSNRAVLGMALASVGGLLAMAGGVVCVPLGVIAMWIHGYRRFRSYLLYGVISGGALAGYLLYAPFLLDGVGGNVASTRFSWEMLPWMAAMVGSPLTFRNEAIAAWIGGGILALLVLQFMYWLIVRRNHYVWPWLLLCLFALGNILLIASGRYGEGRIYIALNERYATISSLLVVALWALSVMTLATPDIRDVVMRLLSAVSLVGITLGYLLTAYFWTSPIYENQFVGGYPAEDLVSYFDCLDTFHLVRDSSACIPDMPTTQFDRLAAHQLAGFARQSPQMTLSSAYHSSDAVVIDAPEAFATVHIRDWLLADVPPSQILHRFTSDQQAIADEYFPRLDHPPQTASLDDTDQLAAFVDNANRVWTISRNQLSSNLPDERWILTHQQVLPYDYEALLWTRLPETQATLAVWDEHIQLTGWALHDSVSVKRCQTVTVDLFWVLQDTAPATDYAITVVAVDTNGQGVARQDQQPLIPTSQWEAGDLYATTHELVISCDLPPGDYPMLLGVYDETESYPAQTSAGDFISSQLYLTTLVVPE